MGLLLSRALYMSNSIMVLLTWWGIGTTMMLFCRVLIDKFVLPEVDLDNELHNEQKATTEEHTQLERPVSSANWGVALLQGAMTISVVQCLNTFLRDCEFEFGLW